jgi:hypothetical protein
LIDWRDLLIEMERRTNAKEQCEALRNLLPLEMMTSKSDCSILPTLPIAILELITNWLTCHDVVRVWKAGDERLRRQLEVGGVTRFSGSFSSCSAFNFKDRPLDWPSIIVRFVSLKELSIVNRYDCRELEVPMADLERIPRTLTKLEVARFFSLSSGDEVSPILGRRLPLLLELTVICPMNVDVAWACGLPKRLQSLSLQVSTSDVGRFCGALRMRTCQLVRLKLVLLKKSRLLSHDDSIEFNPSILPPNLTSLDISHGYCCAILDREADHDAAGETTNLANFPASSSFGFDHHFYSSSSWTFPPSLINLTFPFEWKTVPKNVLALLPSELESLDLGMSDLVLRGEEASCLPGKLLVLSGFLASIEAFAISLLPNTITTMLLTPTRILKISELKQIPSNLSSLRLVGLSSSHLSFLPESITFLDSPIDYFHPFQEDDEMCESSNLGTVFPKRMKRWINGRFPTHWPSLSSQITNECSSDTESETMSNVEGEETSIQMDGHVVQQDFPESLLHISMTTPTANSLICFPIFLETLDIDIECHNRFELKYGDFCWTSFLPLSLRSLKLKCSGGSFIRSKLVQSLPSGITSLDITSTGPLLPIHLNCFHQLPSELLEMTFKWTPGVGHEFWPFFDLPSKLYSLTLAPANPFLNFALVNNVVTGEMTTLSSTSTVIVDFNQISRLEHTNLLYLNIPYPSGNDYGSVMAWIQEKSCKKMEISFV